MKVDPNQLPAAPCKKQISRVTLVPTPAAFGSQSMDRYFRELWRQQESENHSFEFEYLANKPSDHSLRSHRMARAFAKYIHFPISAYTQTEARIVHILDHSESHLIPFLGAAKAKVVTVHDIAPLLGHTDCNAAQVARFRRNIHKLKLADLLLSDSEFTASTLRGEFANDIPEIKVIPLGVDCCRFRRIDSSRPTPSEKPVILVVGSCSPRKNLKILPEVLRQLTEKICPIHLRRIGPDLPVNLLEQVDELGSRVEVESIRCVSEDQLISYYQTASCLFFPSTFEGFGLPPLEAMACGTPVVCSNASSLPEVGGDAVHYFCPGEPEDAAYALTRVLTDSNLREAMSQKGLRRAAQFDWSVHFEKLCTIYHDLD